MLCRDRDPWGSSDDASQSIMHADLSKRRILQFLRGQHTVPHYTIPIPLCPEHKHIQKRAPKFAKELDTARETSSANTQYFSRFGCDLGVFRTRRVHAKIWPYPATLMTTLDQICSSFSECDHNRKKSFLIHQFHDTF